MAGIEPERRAPPEVADPSRPPIAACWFSVERAAEGIVRLREAHVDPYAVGDVWLVCGTQRALAVDAGSGLAPSAPLAEAVAERPVAAVALNPYYDHAGGWADYAERLCHPLDAPALADPRAENESLHDFLTPETLAARPDADFELAVHAMRPARATGLVEDGATIDLGGRRLEVLHVPGRSPGGLALWEAETGALFTSDMLYDGPHGPAWPPDAPAAYVESLRRFATLPVERVFPGHYGPFDGARMRALIAEQTADLSL
ncbi:MAG: MBL fold metallo-hydrolase [Marivibrio sp.]|uniref:MBL fold metallo-hydrolase n=1 Tax=Marivibrio sp. TaxID=2039719 RepID=UPI0032EEDDA9